MTDSGRHRAVSRRIVPVGSIVTITVLVLLGVFFQARSQSGQPSVKAVQLLVAPTQTSSALAPAPSSIPGVLPTSVSTTAGVTKSQPVRLTIPSIGVNTALQPLGLEADGSLQPPSQWGVAGWYAKGIYPGQVGPAVIAGHIDSINGPAVFYRLRELGVGDRVNVTEQNGSVLAFVVDGVQSFPKKQFPAAAVYGPSPYPLLRLITCTGDFDWATHNYLDNLVVTAHLV